MWALMRQKCHLWCHQQIVEILNNRWAELGGDVQTVNPKYIIITDDWLKK